MSKRPSYRLQLIISDVDADLKDWLEANPGRARVMVREAMREWLVRHGAEPGTGAQPRRTATKSVSTVAAPPPPAIAAAAPVTAASPPPASVAQAADPVAPAAHADGKPVDLDRLKRLLGANKEFV